MERQNQFQSNLFSKGYGVSTCGNIITISDRFLQVQGRNIQFINVHRM